jgi:hypothetical protein
MKQYTEEQVRKAIELAREVHTEGSAYMERDEYDYSQDEIINLLKPIELPSDEEIEKSANSQSHYEGAMWFKYKILNQNK